MTTTRTVSAWTGAVVAALGMTVSLVAQSAPPTGQGAGRTSVAPAPAGARAPAPPKPAAPPTPGDYLIGPDDILTVVFWRDKDMTQDVVVRPDGKISLTLLNEIQAAGLTPDQLREAVAKADEKYEDSPIVNVLVKQINSRKVYVQGEGIAKPGPYPITGRLTLLQVISMAGSFTEYAKKDKIVVLRVENGEEKRYLFNYKDFIDGKNLKQNKNLELLPGDTVVVPGS